MVSGLYDEIVHPSSGVFRELGSMVIAKDGNRSMPAGIADGNSEEGIYCGLMPFIALGNSKEGFVQYKMKNEIILKCCSRRFRFGDLSVRIQER